MSALDLLIPTPRKVEFDRLILRALPERVWEAVRHGDLARSPLVRALFALRTLPDWLRGRGQGFPRTSLRLDDMRSSPEQPGFQILVDDPPHEICVGAIGKVWQPSIEFIHVDGAEAFAAYHHEGFAKVAWGIRIVPHQGGSQLDFELRVDTTDEPSWTRFQRYFRLIGAGSHFIRHAALGALAQALESGDHHNDKVSLPGDEQLSDARCQRTDHIDVAATPERIWPWLVQMGGYRGGFYGADWLLDDSASSAREVHPELQRLAVGDVLAANDEGSEGFEVLRLQAAKVLVLGHHHDGYADRQIPFRSMRRECSWSTTWAFVLEPIDEHHTRLWMRARFAFASDEQLQEAWIHPVQRMMRGLQLRDLAERIEGRRPRDDGHDVWEGLGGAGLMVASLLTPFLRSRRSRWGLDDEAAGRTYPGDALVVAPRWSWTHGVEIEAPAEEVWPWVAQVGADRAGFYSYQWLENAAGCELRNAEAIHPEWQVREGDSLRLHPQMPPLRVAHLDPGHFFVAHAPVDAQAHTEGKPWVEASWLFLVEALGPQRCRFISRYRADCSDDVATRLSFGPLLLEPVGFAMDRRMLLGVKKRAERAHQASCARPGTGCA